MHHIMYKQEHKSNDECKVIKGQMKAIKITRYPSNGTTEEMENACTRIRDTISSSPFHQPTEGQTLF